MMKFEMDLGSAFVVSFVVAEQVQCCSDQVSLFTKCYFLL